LGDCLVLPAPYIVPIDVFAFSISVIIKICVHMVNVAFGRGTARELKRNLMVRWPEQSPLCHKLVGRTNSVMTVEVDGVTTTISVWRGDGRRATT
jgi:hypothetical protein